MKVKASADLSNVSTLDDLSRFATQVLRDIVDAVNGNITFSDNIKSSASSVTFDAADTEVQVSHGLGKVPTGYFLTGASAAMSLYNGDSENTDKFLYIKSNATGSARVLIF